MIRYDDEYNANIARIVSNYNRKVARLNKAGARLLPQKASVRSLKAEFTNRGDLNRRLRELQRFSRRGAENIVTIDGKEFTAYDVDIFRRRLRSERARLSKDIAAAAAYKSQYPMQHDIYTANLQARRAALSANWTDLIGGKIGQRLVEEPARNMQTYDNYLQLLFEDAYQMDFPEDKINYIKDRLLRLKPRQFMRALEDDPNIQLIFEYYHSLTRTSGGMENNAYDAFQQLYENIDAIIEKYK